MIKIKLLITVLFQILFVSNAFSQKKQIIDSLKKLVDTTLINTVDSNKVNSLNELAWALRTKEKEDAIKYSNQAISISKVINYYKGEADAYKNIGGIYYLQSDYYNAYENYMKSLSIYRSIKDKESIAKIIRNIGSVFHQQGNYDKALGYFFESLDMRIAMNDKLGEASVYNAIGIVFQEQGEKKIDYAIDYYNKALKIYEELKDSTGISACFLRLGLAYMSDKYLNKKDSIALDYILKFKNNAEVINEKRQLAQASETLGSLYIRLKDFKNALSHLDQAKAIWTQLGNQFGLAKTYQIYATYYTEIGNYEAALRYLNQSLEIVDQIKSLTIYKSIYEQFSELYAIKKDYKNAFYFQKLFYAMVDSLKSDELAKVELLFNFDKKLKEKELIEIQNKAELKQQRIVIYSFIVGLVFLIVLFVVIARSYRLLKSKNRLITNQNFLLNQQKEEITAQRDEIEQQRDTVTLQKEEIEDQKKHIVSSIQYAQRIQQAILPPEQLISEIFPEHFVFFYPRDIVSGDFYWAIKKAKFSFIAAADCTGHGVPGAFMSMLGITFLTEVVNKIDIDNLHPAKILTLLRLQIKQSLRQIGKEGEAKDGMDMALCMINKECNLLEFAGANNPLYLVRKVSENNSNLLSGATPCLIQKTECEEIQLFEYKGDKMPVGIHIKEKNEFTNHAIIYNNGDSCYLFSDGFVDQFGGPQGKKFLSKNLKNFLIQVNHKTMSEQYIDFCNIRSNWLGDKYEQIDDILIIGVKLA